MPQLNIVDMFCGGGGESTGLMQAANKFGYDVKLAAINHWERAIETHSVKAEHFCESVQNLNPEKMMELYEVKNERI